VGLHVENLAEFRSFISRFRSGIGTLNGECERMKFSILEFCAWMDRCVDDATEEVSAAEAELASCEQALSYCEAQEDEDYIPDCSWEAQAVSAANHRLDQARETLHEVRRLRHKINERRGAMLRSIRNAKREFHDAASRGIRYLRDQDQQMEAILRLQSPGI
jgi:chromosome segregation ATPase